MMIKIVIALGLTGLVLATPDDTANTTVVPPEAPAPKTQNTPLEDRQLGTATHYVRLGAPSESAVIPGSSRTALAPIAPGQSRTALAPQYGMPGQSSTSWTPDYLRWRAKNAAYSKGSSYVAPITYAAAPVAYQAPVAYIPAPVAETAYGKETFVDSYTVPVSFDFTVITNENTTPTPTTTTTTTATPCPTLAPAVRNRCSNGIILGAALTSSEDGEVEIVEQQKQFQQLFPQLAQKALGGQSSNSLLQPQGGSTQLGQPVTFQRFQFPSTSAQQQQQTGGATPQQMPSLFNSLTPLTNNAAQNFAPQGAAGQAFPQQSGQGIDLQRLAAYQAALQQQPQTPLQF